MSSLVIAIGRFRNARMRAANNHHYPPQLSALSRVKHVCSSVVRHTSSSADGLEFPQLLLLAKFPLFYIKLPLLHHDYWNYQAGSHAPHQAARAQLGEWILCVSF
jgi:hypothetical protein